MALTLQSQIVNLVNDNDLVRRFLGMNLPASRLNKDIPFW